MNGPRPPGVRGHGAHGRCFVREQWPVTSVSRRWYEVVCYDCHDDPSAPYETVSPALQHLRGPYRESEAWRTCRRHKGISSLRRGLLIVGQVIGFLVPNRGTSGNQAGW